MVGGLSTRTGESKIIETSINGGAVVEASKPRDNRPLFEQLAATRAKAEEEAAAKAIPRNAPPRGLDEEDVAFLDEQNALKAQADAELRGEIELDKQAFESAQLAAQLEAERQEDERKRRSLIASTQAAAAAAAAKKGNKSVVVVRKKDGDAGNGHASPGGGASVGFKRNREDATHHDHQRHDHIEHAEADHDQHQAASPTATPASTSSAAPQRQNHAPASTVTATKLPAPRFAKRQAATSSAAAAPSAATGSGGLGLVDYGSDDSEE